MPKKTEKAGVEEKDLKEFFFPTVGQGISIRAASREEAEQQAREIQGNLAGPSSSTSV